ncbi:sensor domain-containing diguanylate cyclase [Pseudodesulfovibrio sp.]|uniref:sensor domain-containing diguanylate cyclase n=1 Tax=unclassified Pseudodesulfovibrio TaxID=2661612 RepID=UPI003B006E2C
MQVFHKEEKLLEQAQSVLGRLAGLDAEANSTMRDLVHGYARLLRQARRMMTMGDRIQGALTALNGELKASESKYRGVFENVTEGIYRCLPDGRFIEVNPSLAGMFGFSDSESFLSEVSDIRALFQTPDDYNQYTSLLVSDGVRSREVEVCGPDNVCRWVEVSASMVHGGADGDLDTVVGVFADVTERKGMLEEMCRLARTDSLTGLWNRGYFMELAGRELARNRRGALPLSLLILDVDFFKNVNDSYGHDAGDKALVCLAQALSSAVREVDLAARYGGEEFVVLLPDTTAGEACIVAQRIAQRIREASVECGNVRFSLTVSVGLAALEEGDDLDNLLKFADIALYAAKKKGRDRVEAYRRGSSECGLSRVACGDGAGRTE